MTSPTRHQGHFDNVRRDLHRRFGHRLDAERIDEVLDDAIAESADAAVSNFLPTLVNREAEERLTELLAHLDPVAVCRKEIVFVSRHNAGRTQLAASITRALAAEDVSVREMGQSPSEGINPVVIEALREAGMPTDGLVQLTLVPRTVHRADVVVLMGDDVDEIPDVPGDRYERWQVPDPEGHDIEEVRRIRDQLVGLISVLLSDMGVEQSPLTDQAVAAP